MNAQELLKSTFDAVEEVVRAKVPPTHKIEIFKPVKWAFSPAAKESFTEFGYSHGCYNPHAAGEHHTRRFSVGEERNGWVVLNSAGGEWLVDEATALWSPQLTRYDQGDDGRIVMGMHQRPILSPDMASVVLSGAEGGVTMGINNEGLRYVANALIQLAHNPPRT